MKTKFIVPLDQYEMKGKRANLHGSIDSRDGTIVESNQTRNNS